MTPSNIAHLRLYQQHIAASSFKKPAEAVAWLGAVQAQDYLGALWAVGLRLQHAAEAGIEQALAEGSLIRTWPMRGTLHFVAAADVRWMLELLTPRMIAGAAGRHRHLGLDEAAFARSRDAFTRALQGGRQLPRREMMQVLESAHISTAGQRGIHILGRLAQEGLICFGARQGKQQTFTLLAEWAPHAKSMAREEALAELAKRYFTGHGPAGLQDFVWWSGLTTSDARAGIEMARPQLVQEVIDGQTCWLSPSMPAAKELPSAAYLLPAFDEYLVGYKDRRAVLDPLHVKRINAGGGLLSPTIVIQGRVVGTWKRELKKGRVVLTPSPFAELKKNEQRLLSAAAGRYGEFLGLPVVLE